MMKARPKYQKIADLYELSMPSTMVPWQHFHATRKTIIATYELSTIVDGLELNIFSYKWLLTSVRNVSNRAFV